MIFKITSVYRWSLAVLVEANCTTNFMLVWSNGCIWWLQKLSVIVYFYSHFVTVRGTFLMNYVIVLWLIKSWVSQFLCSAYWLILSRKSIWNRIKVWVMLRIWVVWFLSWKGCVFSSHRWESWSCWLVQLPLSFRDYWVVYDVHWRMWISTTWRKSCLVWQHTDTDWALVRRQGGPLYVLLSPLRQVLGVRPHVLLLRNQESIAWTWRKCTYRLCRLRWCILVFLTRYSGGYKPTLLAQNFAISMTPS